MAYCSPADLKTLTNYSSEEYPAEIIAAIIEVADRRCDARIREAGLTAPVPAPVPDTLRDASANYAAAIYLDRKRTDLSRPNSLSLEGLSFGTSPDTEIKRHEDLAKKSLERYIAEEEEQGGGVAGTYCEIVEGD